MYQEIIICPDIFEKIIESYTVDSDSDLDLKTYKENLKLKKLVLDSGDKAYLFNSINSIISKADNLGKQKCNAILNQFLTSNRVEFKEIKNEAKYISLKEYNNAIHLGFLTESKIINSYDIGMKSMKLLFNELEVIDIDEFVAPPINSCLYNWNRVLKFKKGDVVDIFHILRYYFQDTKKLRIEDKYLRGKKRQFPNLIKLLLKCKSLEELELITILYDETEKDRDKNIFLNQFRQELKRIKNIKTKIVPSEKDMHDRQYFTDEFVIDFSSGLDFVDENNRVTKKTVKISIEKR